MNLKKNIKLENINLFFEEEMILENINFSFDITERIGIIGSTGSGKTTLANIITGLESISKGKIEKEEDYFIPLILQSTEKQFFEETVEKDLLFGPMNQKLSAEDSEIRIKNALELVGIDYEKYRDKSPFELSGGEQRKVAIASILSMKYDFLVFDEPTVGLDNPGIKKLSLILEKMREQSRGYIIISHITDFLFENVDRVIALKEGHLLFDTGLEHIDDFLVEMESCNVDIPGNLKIFHRLKQKGILDKGIKFSNDNDFLTQYLRGRK